MKPTGPLGMCPVMVLCAAMAGAAAAAPADVSFDGDVTFGPAGFVELEIGGSLPGAEHDRIQVAGEASLHGALVLVPTGGFGSTAGEQATVFTWGTRSGEFASVSGVQQANGLDLAASYGTSALAVTTRLRGDVDGDGSVTPADLAVVDGNLAALTTDYGAGDVTGDGVVDAQDQAVVDAALGPPAVPVLGLLGVGALAVLLAAAGSGALRTRRGVPG